MADLERARQLALALELAISGAVARNLIADGAFAETLEAMAADLSESLLDSAGISPALVHAHCMEGHG